MITGIFTWALAIGCLACAAWAVTERPRHALAHRRQQRRQAELRVRRILADHAAAGHPRHERLATPADLAMMPALYGFARWPWPCPCTLTFLDGGRAVVQPCEQHRGDWKQHRDFAAWAAEMARQR